MKLRSWFYRASAFLAFVASLAGLLSFLPGSSDGGDSLNQKDSLNEVKYLWSGALRATGCIVVAGMSRPSASCFLVVSESPDLSDSLVAGPYEASPADNLMTKMKITGLEPARQYYYAVASNGRIDLSPEDIGTFTTPAIRPFSFRMTVGSCSGTGNHQVYEAMRRKLPLFHLTTGDFHYMNPNSAFDIDVHRRPYELEILGPAASGKFFREVPLAYVWDDHDYCGDNSNGFSAGKENARLAYQEYVPHYPLVEGAGNVAIYQAFTIGRVHFILSDLRSQRTLRSIMSERQKEWFRKECLYARDNNLIIAWVTGISYGGQNRDNWGGFRKERIALANFFRDNDIRNMFILSGDAHMAGIDDGSNHDFSTGPENPHRYPVFQAAALNKRGSFKGGRYSEGGTFPNPDNSTGQYGVVDVIDKGGDSISIEFTAYRTQGNSVAERVLTSYSFSRNLAGAGPDAFLHSTPLSDDAVVLSWEMPRTQKDLQLFRSTDSIKFEEIGRIKSRTGVLEDTAAIPGWNYYLLKDSAVAMESKAFLEGISVAILPQSEKDSLVLVVGNFSLERNGKCSVFEKDGTSGQDYNFALRQGQNLVTVDAGHLKSDTCHLLVTVGTHRHLTRFIRGR